MLAEGLREDWDVVTIDTGQHYDWELNGVHYEQLGVHPPDLFLEVGSGGHAQQTSSVLVRVSEELEQYRPDAVIVIGDTNSTLGCAMAAAKHRIFLAHVEAGLRAEDFHMAEEINRRVVDEVSQLLCTPSVRATEYLSSRACQAQTVAFTGDVARDVLEAAKNQPGVPPAPWEEHGITRPYVLATLHRAELTSRKEWLSEIIRGLGSLPYPVFFPAHPRTVAVLEEHGLDSIIPDNVFLSAPVGYLDLISWVQNAEAVVTDSGGLQREAYWLSVPCVTIRNESEWVETVEEGANILLAPEDSFGLSDAVAQHPGRERGWDGAAYGTGKAVKAVRDALRTRFG